MSSLRNSLHNLQGGFVQALVHLTLPLSCRKSFVAREHGVKTAMYYVAFLDARKAFDTVCHHGLFVKLLEYSLIGNVWSLLFYWYEHLTSAVKWDTRLSRVFRICQGFNQGALLSPLLYALYITDFLSGLDKLNLGISVSPTFCGVLAYADDIHVLSRPLQLMLNYCYILGTVHSIHQSLPS